MNNIFRGLIAGYGAKKLGGGCFGTIIVFVIIWVALGQCSWSSDARLAPETYPADRHVSAPAKIGNMSLLFRGSFSPSETLWGNPMASCTILEERIEHS